MKRLVCRLTVHDWWALGYPPARRWECHRCGCIREEPARTVELPTLQQGSLEWRLVEFTDSELELELEHRREARADD